MSNPLTVRSGSPTGVIVEPAHSPLPAARFSPVRQVTRRAAANSRPSCLDACRGSVSSRRLTAVVACCAGGVLALFPAPSARAGTYTIGDCPNAFNHSTVAGPWQFFGPSTGVTLKTECGGNPAAIWFATPDLPATPLGFRASTEGTQRSILGARLWWRAFGSPSAEVEAEMEATYGPEEFSATGQWDGSGALVEQMSTPEEFRFPASDHVTAIQFAEHCYVGGKCPMSESFGLGIEIFGAELTLSDERPPTVSITGVKDTGGPGFRGQLQTTFTATDPDAGVKKAELLLEGAPVATHDYSSSCSYTELRPCQSPVSDQLESPPISFVESAHQLAVRVTDAAENTTVTPVPPVANGVPCTDPTIALAADHRRTAVTVPFGHGAIVEGRLGCGPTPIPGASVALATSTTLPGAPAAPSTTVQTAPAGTFRYQVAPGPSRDLTFSYRAYSNESTPTTQATVHVNVKPRIRLQISPRRTHNGGTIHWHGQVEGGPYPANAMPLLVQVKEGKRWQTFDELRAHNGKIAYRYTFLRTTSPTTYSFRVALPSGGAVGYPYATGSSQPIKVHVR